MDEYNRKAGLDATLMAIADPTRREILLRLAGEDARVTELARHFPISLNSTSKHIKVLERAGLVRRTVSGRDHVLSLNAAPLADAVKWIEQVGAFWDERLAGLDRFVSARRKKENDHG